LVVASAGRRSPARLRSRASRSDRLQKCLVCGAAQRVSAVLFDGARAHSVAPVSNDVGTWTVPAGYRTDSEYLRIRSGSSMCTHAGVRTVSSSHSADAPLPRASAGSHRARGQPPTGRGSSLRRVPVGGFLIPWRSTALHGARTKSCICTPTRTVSFLSLTAPVTASASTTPTVHRQTTDAVAALHSPGPLGRLT
jgi:hypothetical protein